MRQPRTAQSTNYLSSTDVEAYAKTTRRTLLECAKRDVFQPFLVNDDPSSNRRWTLTQAQIMRYMPVFKRNGVTPGDLAELSQQGHAAVCDALEGFLAEELRTARRSAKSMQRYQQELNDSAHINNAGRHYLRYLPQRYFALAPMLNGSERAGGAQYMQLILRLIEVSQVVGWVPLSLTGSLTCFSADGQKARPFAFVELASKPEPAPSAECNADSGCYAGISKQLACGGSCRLCMRFGRKPTDREKFAWTTREQLKPGDRLEHAVMVSSLKTPYPCGPWASFTHTACGISTPESKNTFADECAALPRLMPQVTRLPYGVTACVMPAGMYLCCRHDERTVARATEFAVGLADALPHHNVTPAEELATHEQLCRIMKPVFHDASNRSNGMGMPPTIGDPELLGTSIPVSTGDFSQITVLNNAALFPYDGCCVVCAELPPLMTSDPPRYETQILVDASGKIAPPRSSKKLSFGLFTNFIWWFKLTFNTICCDIFYFEMIFPMRS